MLACWPLRDRLTYWYFNGLSNIVNKKMAKNELFFATPDRKSSELKSRVNSGRRELREFNNI
jgi:hypothetical protein